MNGKVRVDTIADFSDHMMSEVWVVEEEMNEECFEQRDVRNSL